jgi:hypothetical protein
MKMKLKNLSIYIATLAVLSGLLLATAGARTRDTIPPKAEAGPSQTVNQGALVHFDGSGSTDNRWIASFTWTFVDGISRKLTGKNPTYAFTNAGIFTVTLNVTDAAGNWDTDTVTITVLDATPPTILTPIQSPAGNVTLAQMVYISVNITDAGSGVKNATLLYTVNNGLVRIRVLSRNVATGYYETAIPGQLAGAWVKYEIKAYDNAGNIRVESNAGQYYVYQVTVPEFPSLLAVFLLMAATLLALVMSKRKHAMKAISSFWKTLFP